MKQSMRRIGMLCILCNHEEFELNEYVEFLEVNGKGVERDESNNPIIDMQSFYKWCNNRNEWNVECGLDNIKFFEPYNTEVYVEGRVSLWNGKVNTCNEFKSVYDAIIGCIKGVDFFDATWEDGRIYVTASHHDGTNRYVIRFRDQRKKLPYLYAQLNY